MVKTKQGIGKGKEKERKGEGQGKEKERNNYGKSCENEPKMIALGTLGDRFWMVFGAWARLGGARGASGGMVPEINKKLKLLGAHRIAFWRLLAPLGRLWARLGRLWAIFWLHFSEKSIKNALQEGTEK